MTDIDVHHLAAAYALDALDDREWSAFEAHYRACEVCHSDVQQFRQTLTQVAASLATTPPAPVGAASLKDRVMAEVAVTRQISPSLVAPIALVQRRRVRVVTSLMAAAAAMILIVVGVVSLRDRNVDAYSASLAKVMDQPDAKVVTLENKSGAAGTFKVAWSNTLGEAVLIGEDLPAAPADKAYELWLVTPDQTMAMYVLDPARDGNVHRALQAPAQPTAWAITVEPKAGTAVATGDIIYIATV